MAPGKDARIAYVLKVYPRLSQTFILNEILAHEADGLELEIFSLRPARDEPPHESAARVRAPVTYIERGKSGGSLFWNELREARSELPRLWQTLQQAGDEDVANIQQAVRLARAVQARGIDHLHAHFARVATTVARLAAQIAGITYSFTAHARDIFHDVVRTDDVERKIQDAAAVVTVSRFNLAFMAESFQGAEGRVELVHNGLHLDHFPFSVPRERAPRLLGVGRLVPKKGFEDLVDACGVLADAGREFQCEIIGTGPLEEALRARIAERGLEDRVSMLGPLPQGEVSKRLIAASVLAVPCRVAEDGDRDGLPTVLLEAMALGTPCVSTDVTGIPEVLHDGETGLAVPQNDPAALAAACGRLLADADLRVRVATRARRLIESEFDARQTSARLRKVLKRAARAGARRAPDGAASATGPSTLAEEESASDQRVQGGSGS